MRRRLANLLLSVFLVPALTGVGAPLCAPTTQASAQMTHIASSHPAAGHDLGSGHGTPMEHQHRSDTQAPCDGSMGTNCCTAMVGCSATAALPVTVAEVAMTPPVERAPLVSVAELPVARVFPPEPPPPKV